MEELSQGTIVHPMEWFSEYLCYAYTRYLDGRMLVFESKLDGMQQQYDALDEAIRTVGYVGTSSLVLENVSGQTDLCLGDANPLSKPTGRTRKSK
jgi:hypothetical protein